MGEVRGINFDEFKKLFKEELEKEAGLPMPELTREYERILRVFFVGSVVLRKWDFEQTEKQWAERSKSK